MRIPSQSHCKYKGYDFYLDDGEATEFAGKIQMKDGLLRVFGACNGCIPSMSYLKVFFNHQLCRLTISDNPEYMNLPDEDLILTNEMKQNIMRILKSPTEYFESGWKQIQYGIGELEEVPIQDSIPNYLNL